MRLVGKLIIGVGLTINNFFCPVQDYYELIRDAVHEIQFSKIYGLKATPLEVS
jgi:hypothetical protein